MESLVKFINLIKGFKTGAKVAGLIIALLGFIIDLLLLSKGIHTPYYLKSIYIIIGAASIILIVNDFCIWKEQQKIKKEKQEKLINTIKYIKGAELEMLHKYTDTGSLNVKLETDEDIDTAFSLRQILGGRIGIMADRAIISSNTLEIFEKALKI